MASMMNKSIGDIDPMGDDERLRQLGYKPVFSRSWRKFTNIAVTISAMSVLLSVPASFGTGLYYGGPVVMVWGWIAVSFCAICVALGMSELSSAYPTSGGMYFWSFKLLGPKVGPFVCWTTGWVNMLGQIASLASTNYYTTNLIQTFILLATGTARPSEEALALADATKDTPDYEEPTGTGFTFTREQTLGLYAGVLVLCALLNTIGGKLLIYITEFAAIWHIVGITILIVAIPIIAKEHQPASFVFGSFKSDLGYDSGLPNKFYIAAMALLLPAYAYTGYDGPAHMAEETKNAALSNPRGIMAGVYFMAVAGLAWVISLLFTVSDRLYVLGEGDITPEADGDVVAQILWDAFQQRMGDGRHSLGMLIIPILGVFFCSVSTLTYISRILFAYSRDRAVPLSWLFIKIAPNQVPIWAVWGATLGAFILVVPSVKNDQALAAVLSLSTISLNLAYVSPSFFRITWGRNRFVPGPWNLGKWAYPINTIASLWVGFAVVIFSLPTEYPVDMATNGNYAGIVFLGVALLSVAWFCFPYFGAYRWFKGPVNEISAEEEEAAQEIDLSVKRKALAEENPSV